ncbi:uncharacterized protein LOC115816706 [Chanos chanos]|uniref:Uncharacterized protein LOC115816706 n=1 Tax=Chanos chanos TaxID=29144 RepID=A0A6J2VWY6_CHACN|nr:uncharacterized protein LOC115816706 [Chanos chanos]
MKLESPELLADPVSAEMMRECVENLGPYSQTLANAGRTIVNHVISNCTSATVRSWLQQERNNVLFLNYVRYMNVQFKSYQAEMEKKLHYGLIHIVFVAHGKITGKPVPACCLLPLNSIDHVVLYSPWNCSIDAKAAAGIALGTITPDKRVFNPAENTPNPIPQGWNFIRQAGETLIPEIIVSPVTSNEPVWQIFSEIKNSGFWHENRLLIPYVVQEENSYLSPEIPLHLLLLALSCALPVSVKIRFHLAACLNRTEDVTDRQMLQQYAWTPDRTVMSANLDQTIQNPRLFEAFQSMFGVAG